MFHAFQCVNSPAFCAIVTSVPMRFCCTLHKPVMRCGSMQPSERTYWLRISTSVCLMSRPSVHFGQNFFWLGVASSLMRNGLRAESTYWPEMWRESCFCSTWTWSNKKMVWLSSSRPAFVRSKNTSSLRLYTTYFLSAIARKLCSHYGQGWSSKGCRCWSGAADSTYA